MTDREPTERAGEFDANTLRLWAQEADRLAERCAAANLADPVRHMRLAGAALRNRAATLEGQQAPPRGKK